MDNNDIKRALLIILDGVGIGPNSENNGWSLANTPNIDLLLNDYPSTSIEASGRSVGLPDGQMGNSEVGQLNIGAGRVVFQDLLRINNAIKEGTFDPNNVLRNAFVEAKDKGVDVHFIGLLSDGGVHSSHCCLCCTVWAAGRRSLRARSSRMRMSSSRTCSMGCRCKP